jgi:HNH endonuclease
MSLPGAKNAMHRAIEALYWRPLNEQERERIWQYFHSRCAYCDKEIDRKHRHGHMDHLECSRTGGTNYIRNRVLACKECNGNEKREQCWQEFLRSKCANSTTFRLRKNRIDMWQSLFPVLPPIVLNREAQKARLAVLNSVKVFEREFKRFRSLVPKRRIPNL